VPQHIELFLGNLFFELALKLQFNSAFVALELTQVLKLKI
jgi:hypothetical protein